uniref:Uncharacterized protein n=1 Tax=Megaselia scalaris TaxID=36166 RepID=T1H1W5_MEGSC
MNRVLRHFEIQQGIGNVKETYFSIVGTMFLSLGFTSNQYHTLFIGIIMKTVLAYCYALKSPSTIYRSYSGMVSRV